MVVLSSKTTSADKALTDLSLPYELWPVISFSLTSLTSLFSPSPFSLPCAAMFHSLEMEDNLSATAYIDAK